MAESESQAFAEHLAGCPTCKSEVDQLRPLVQSLQAVGPEELPEEIAARIRESLSDHAVGRAKSWRASPRRILAVAASVILVVGAVILWRTMLDRTRHPLSTEAGRGAAAEPVLGEDDYVDALALVWIDDVQDPDEAASDSDDVFTAEIEDVAARIESMLHEVEQELEPDRSDSEPDNGEGSAPRTFGRNATT